MAENPRTVKNKMTYAVELECDDPDTRHYVHIWNEAENGCKPVLRPSILAEGEACTIPNVFNAAAKKFGDKPTIGTRAIEQISHEGKKQFWTKGPFEFRTFKQFHGDIVTAAKGLMELEGLEGGGTAALMGDTSAEWHMAAQMCFQCGIVITTVYATLGPEAMLHGINETESSVIFIDYPLFDGLRDTVLAKATHVKHIVLIGKCFVPKATVGKEHKAFPSPDEVAALPKVAAATVTTVEVLTAAGEKSSADLQARAPAEEGLAFIMYTSGSTGTPKGVQLTHQNFVGYAAGVEKQDYLRPCPTDVNISFLPLAHIFALSTEIIVMAAGTKICYGHARTLTGSSPYVHPSNPEGGDISACRPTVLLLVPAVLELIKTGLNMKLSKMEGLKGRLVRGAVQKAQGQDVTEGGASGCLLSLGLTNLLLHKVKAQLGLENVRLIIAGGAPLAPETQDFVNSVIGPVAQGYGATETTGCASVTEATETGAKPKRPVDKALGIVGQLNPALELKLRSVPEMGYLVTDSPPRGEILLGGYVVSQKGYFKMPDKNKEDFPQHSDGRAWFHTGDIGVFTELGQLKIVDRKKDLIKTDKGEFVSLGKVENVLKQVKWIGACALFVQGSKDHCALIVSQPERGWASVGGEPQEEELLKEIQTTCKQLGLATFEIPTKVKIDQTIWTPENGLVTPSMKVQRQAIRVHYNTPGGLLEQMNYRFPE